MFWGIFKKSPPIKEGLPIVNYFLINPKSFCKLYLIALLGVDLDLATFHFTQKSESHLLVWHIRWYNGDQQDE